jgi:hypothetical protein
MVRGKVDCYLRPRRTLSFAQSHNLAIRLATTPYVTCANDDIEFIDGRWWSGIMETFEQNDERVVAVNPSSVKIPGWGYGVGGDFEVVPNLPPTYPRRLRGVIDGIATWCTVFHAARMREALEEEQSRFGIENPHNLYFDEKFHPAGGEDYDLNARMYRLGRRMVGTSRSWVYHHWSATKDHVNLLPALDESLCWNNFDELWPPESNEGQGMNLWGHRTAPNGERIPLRRVPRVTGRAL